MSHFSLPTRLGRGAVAALLLVAFAATAPAQDNRISARLLFGASTPSGLLENFYEPGGSVGIQGSWRLNDHFGVVSTSMWANAPTYRAGRVPTDGLSWTFDVGVEARTPKIAADIGSSWRLQPFIGGGFGSRSYMEADYYGSTTGFAGYGAAGLDLNRNQSWFGIRLEARGYQTTFTDVEHLHPRESGSAVDVLLGVRIR